MGAQLREYRQRIRSVTAMKKITRAFELIATSRMMKAQQRTAASLPYTRAITRAVSAVATYSNEDHPLTTEKPNPTRSAMLVITSDRGLAGAYSGNVIKEAERLRGKLTSEGKTVDTYTCGRKAAAYYGFRNRQLAGQWSGFSDSPTYDAAQEISDTLVEAFVTPTEEGGVDEIHVVYTRFVNMVTQEPEVLRLLPLEVVEGEAPPAADDVLPLYEFEPGASGVLDALLPQYVRSRIFNALLTSAASELAARQRAMKSATDNADTLIKKYTRLANTARQAEITQEISEIVGGATALADASPSH